MDQKSLHIFITLYECGSMHKAAERLYMSQQGISKQIRLIEEELQAPLFVRSSSGVQPTEAGTYFYGEALQLRAGYERVVRKLRDMAQGMEVVRIACAYGTMYTLFPVIKRFEQEHPNVHIEWSEVTDREAEQALVREEAELAVGIQGMEAGYVEFSPLYSRQVCLLVYEGHPLYERNSLAVTELEKEPVIIEGSDFQIHELFINTCRQAGFTPNIIAETADITFCQKLAAMKEGLAVTVDFVADTAKPAGVRAIPLLDPPMQWNVGLLKLKGVRYGKAAGAFAEALLKACRQ